MPLLEGTHVGRVSKGNQTRPSGFNRIKAIGPLSVVRNRSDSTKLEAVSVKPADSKKRTQNMDLQRQQVEESGILGLNSGESPSHETTTKPHRAMQITAEPPTGLLRRP